MLKRKLKNAGLPVLDNPSHIVPVMICDPVHTKQVSDALFEEHGIYVQPINYPTVPRGAERLRLTPSPLHTDVQIDHLVQSLSALWETCQIAQGYSVRAAAE